MSLTGNSHPILTRGFRVSREPPPHIHPYHQGCKSLGRAGPLGPGRAGLSGLARPNQISGRNGPAQLKSWAVTARPGPAQLKS